MLRNKKGFTLVELLVVVAIIGLLSTLAVVALNNAREKARDAKRVADIKQVQTALELFFGDNNGYPAAATAVVLGDANHVQLCTPGFNAGGVACTGTVYMSRVPSNPPGPGGTAYNYTSAVTSTYSLTFQLEANTGGLTCTSSVCTATPSGIQ